VAVDPIFVFLVVAALVAAAGFVGIYAAQAPWQASNVGRAMMTLASSLVAICIVSLLFTFLGPDYALRTLIRDLSWTGLNIGLWWQLINLVVLQRSQSTRGHECLEEHREDQDKLALD
jgi:asparagine N-glycosylation enzyme membrane subunit Stt3